VHVTDHDIAEVESRLGIRLPIDYRRFALLPSSQRVGGIFSDADQTITVNESNRQTSWLGRPLDRTFYIFGKDERGRELFLDLDFPDPPVMLADHEGHRATIQARTFMEWVSRFDAV
jgi:hypothetical protein